MPQLYNKAVMTNAGLALLNKAQAGAAAIQFTRMATGDGTYAAEEKTPSALRERTGLKSERNSYAISSIDVDSATGVKLTALLTNQDPATGAALVTDGYYLNEIGLYAKEKDGGDDTEALYSVAVAAVENRDFMPAYTPGAAPAQIVQEYCARVSDAANVTIDCAGAAMLEGDAEKLLEKLTLSYDEKSGELQLKSGETILSTASIEGGSGGGAETEAIQSWGSGNVIGNESSIAVGDDNVIAPDAEGAVAFGGNNKMNKMYTFSAGMLNEVSTIGSIALGRLNVISASAKTYALAIGIKNKPAAAFGSAIGVSLEQGAYGGFACGRWNAVREEVSNDSEARGDAFVVGNGNSDVRGNAFRVSHSGDAYALKAVNSSGADYAEFIKPWADNNPDGEDRVGYFVTVRDGFLHKANAGDYIAGITSGNPSVVGNADEDYYWKYERDAFGRIVLEEIPERVQALDGEGAPMFDENGEPVMEATGGTVKRMKLSADYDKTLQGLYEERKNRPEWDYVGMLGVLPVRDDGTCVPGLFCKCGADGIATLSVERGFDAYMVIERAADGVVKVILR